MFVDASAILAILTDEADARELAGSLDKAHAAGSVTSVLAVWEAAVGLYRMKRIPMAEAEARVREFLTHARVEIVALTGEELTIALQAFDRYGRHRYSDEERNRALNLADCFHYACAKSRGVAVLHKDPGFRLTDIGSAI